MTGRRINLKSDIELFENSLPLRTLALLEKDDIKVALVRGELRQQLGSHTRYPSSDHSLIEFNMNYIEEAMNYKLSNFEVVKSE